MKVVLYVRFRCVNMILRKSIEAKLKRIYQLVVGISPSPWVGFFIMQNEVRE